MPCKKDPKRTDANTGMAKRGSQRQLQIQVNSRREEFDRSILALGSLPVGSKLRWVSPLAEDDFNEYADEEFLLRLDLGQFVGKLKQFWPKGGPCWDGLAALEGSSPRGVVLVEAKSHISEMAGKCRASEKPLRQINQALTETAQDLEVQLTPCWTDGYYQAANRYAHLYFLRKKLDIPTWLIQVYFVNDQSIRHVETPPSSIDEWQHALKQVKARMGFRTQAIPFSHELFINAVEQ